MLEKIVRIGRLFDLYSALLTEKQQRCVELHYLQDFSLSEIAEELCVSRQAVHDMLRRAEHILEEYEGKLRLLERQEQERHRRQHDDEQDEADAHPLPLSRASIGTA